MPRTSERSLLAYAAANVRRLRIKGALTQETLAERAGIDPCTVQDVERMRLNFTMAILGSLADALRVDARQLLRPAAPAPARVGRPRKKRSASRHP